MPQGASLNCFRSLRSSPILVIVVVFVAMMLDVILMTSIDPILPSMLANIHACELSGCNRSSTSSLHIVSDNSSRNYMSLTMEIGILVAAKPLLEMFTNIFVGLFVDRYGHKYPMLFGVVFNFAATVGFGFAPSFSWLLVTRLFQAVASSFSVVAGLALLAETFLNDAERCHATGRAFGGISLGIIVGYPYGSIVYQFLGHQAPFLILGAAALADGALRLLVIMPREPSKKAVEKKQSFFSSISALGVLLCDPYIFIGLGCSFMQHLGLGVFLATGPAWMLQDLHAEQWSIGVVLAIAVFFHFLAQYVTGRVAIKIGRWLFCWIGMVLFAMGMAVYPFCTNIWHVLGPEITVRLGHGTVLCVLSPLLARVADLRHASRYGLVYGLYSASYNLGLGIGPILGGQLSQMMPFRRIYWITASLIFSYSFLSLIYRRFTESKPRKMSKATYGTMEPDDSSVTPPLLGANTVGRDVTKDHPKKMAPHRDEVRENEITAENRDKEPFSSLTV